MHVQRWCDGREKERERKGRRHVRVPDGVAGWLQDGCRIVASCISAMCRVVTTQNGNANGGTTMQWAVNRTIVFIAIFYYNRTPSPSFPFSIRSCLAFCFFGRVACKRGTHDSCIVLFILNRWISFVISVIFIIELRSDGINF